jgi:hypothetical protein
MEITYTIIYDKRNFIELFLKFNANLECATITTLQEKLILIIYIKTLLLL